MMTYILTYGVSYYNNNYFMVKTTYLPQINLYTFSSLFIVLITLMSILITFHFIFFSDIKAYSQELSSQNSSLTWDKATTSDWNNLIGKAKNQSTFNFKDSKNNQSNVLQNLADSVLRSYPNITNTTSQTKINNILNTQITTDAILVTRKDSGGNIETNSAFNSQKIKEFSGLNLAKVTPLTQNTFILESPELISKKSNSQNILSLANLPLDSKYIQVHKKLQTNGNFITEPNILWKANAINTNDTFVRDQWYLNNTGQTVNIESIVKEKGVSGKDINYETDSDFQGNKKTIIAVIDDGVDTNHPDLKDNILRDKNGQSLGFDFSGNRRSTTYPKPPIGWGHGTHVAGIIAAKSNNFNGVSGVCGNCSILPIQFLGPVGGSTINAIRSLYYAVDKGASIINMSWGGAFASPSLEMAINYANSRGAVLIAAAGNSGNEDLLYPAAYQNVLSVASTNNRGLKSPFSTFNKTVDISAPGQHILSTFPMGADLDPFGSQPNTCQDSNYSLKSDGYGYCSGTSMASPVVAGVAGLLKSKYPNWTNAQIKSQIIDTANTDIYALAPNLTNKVGSGIVDATKALKNKPSQKMTFTGFKVNTPNAKPSYLIEPNTQNSINLSFDNPWLEGSNINMQLVSLDTRVTILEDKFPISRLRKGQTVNSNFKIKVNNDFPASTDIKLQLVGNINNKKEVVDLTLPIDKMVVGNKNWNLTNLNNKDGWEVVGDGWNLINNCQKVIQTKENVWHFGNQKCGNYDNDQNGFLVSPRLSINPNKSYSFSFDSWLDNEFYGNNPENTIIGDHATVFLAKVMPDNGINLNGASPIIAFNKECTLDSICGRAKWEKKQFYLPINALRYNSGDYRILIMFNSDNINTKRGWYIKNMSFKEEDNIPVQILKPLLDLGKKDSKDNPIELDLFKEAKVSNIDNDPLMFNFMFEKGEGYVSSNINPATNTGTITININPAYTGDVKINYMLDDGKGGIATGSIIFNYSN
jgi:subtilisin family serine protease